MSFDSLMKDKFISQRRSLTGYDAYGIPIYSYQDWLIDQPCLLQARRGQNTEITDIHGSVVVTGFRLYCRICDITEADHIAVTNGAGGPTYGALTRSFEILSVEQAAGQHHHLQLELKSIEPQQE